LDDHRCQAGRGGDLGVRPTLLQREGVPPLHRRAPAGLAQNGHVEVPGIFFDFAKSDIKPESEPALRAMAKLLQGSAALRVWVVGHTDSVGPADSNVALSEARAAAVVRYLTQKLGIEPRRLSPHGAGPYAPVASNATEDGRARNRHVELVAQP
jgi:OmpA-OmpF porin, OOP family